MAESAEVRTSKCNPDANTVKCREWFAYQRFSGIACRRDHLVVLPEYWQMHK